MDIVETVGAALQMVFKGSDVDCRVLRENVEFQITIREPMFKHMVLHATAEKLERLPQHVVPAFTPIHVVQYLRSKGVIERLSNTEDAIL